MKKESRWQLGSEQEPKSAEHVEDSISGSYEEFQPAIDIGETKRKDKQEIESVRREMQELLERITPKPVVTEERSDNPEVKYVDAAVLEGAFGLADDGVAYVRKDLPPAVRRFVESHELYHLQDQATWGGWLGREIRANFWPGLKDPVGLLATIGASLNRERIKFYINRFKERR